MNQTQEKIINFENDIYIGGLNEEIIGLSYEIKNKFYQNAFNKMIESIPEKKPKLQVAKENYSFFNKCTE
jgi:hypothetical protein